MQDKSAKPLPCLGASCLFSFKKNPFAFHYRQDEASKMPGIYLEFPENIFFEIKILSEKVRFSLSIQQIAKVNPFPWLWLGAFS